MGPRAATARARDEGETEGDDDHDALHGGELTPVHAAIVEWGVTMRTAAAWKRFYASERAALGEAGLDALLDHAPEVPGACVFPHTRLAVTGPLVAAVARTIVRDGAERVLAIGVLHGARERDAELVRSARAGDAAARSALRRVHAAGDDGLASEEFSLDGFAALLERAARRAGRRAPTLVARYPFLVGDDPRSLPGLDELHALAADGCALVATTDPLHHGAGYGTPPDARRDADDPATRAFAQSAVREQLDALEREDWATFGRVASLHQSDFRDAGPVATALLSERGRQRFEIAELALVDYSAALDAPPPTWVAGALLTAGP